MGLRVIRPGLFTTVQDRGRTGYRSFGVPIGGAFDQGSLGLANALVGNPPGDPALELTLIGGVYRAETDLALALAGAPIADPRSFTLRAGEELVLEASDTGARTYLAVRGGWQTPLILGSRSSERKLEAGEILPAAPGSIVSRRPVDRVPDRPESLRIIDGPDADPIRGDARLLESGEYRVTSQSNRMGLRLEGPPIDREAPADRASSPVAPGAIQVTGGQPIVLGVAGGTMGGYLHLAHVIAADLDHLGQLRPGDRVSFRRVGLEEARDWGRIERQARREWLERIRVMASSGLD